MRVGQSAVEYLTTYGWMLLVVAIVGGTIFTTVRGQCSDSVLGFSGDDVTISNFGATQGEKIRVAIGNTASEKTDIEEITFEEEGNKIEIGSVRSIEEFGSEEYSTDGLRESSSCNTIDVTIEYDTESLNDIRASGTIRTGARVINLPGNVSNIPQNGLQMRFDAMTIGRTDGTDIQTWKDLTNGKNNATGVDASRLPEVNADGINGYKALKFEPGPKDTLTMSDKPYLQSRNHTIFATVRFNDVTGTTAVTSKYEPGSRINTLQVRDNKTFINWNDDGGWKNSKGSINISTEPVLLSTRVGANITGYVDGKKDVTEPIEDPLTLNSGVVSFGTVRNPLFLDYWELDGNIGEIIYYNRTLSDPEMDAVHSYLSNKWNLDTS